MSRWNLMRKRHAEALMERMADNPELCSAIERNIELIAEQKEMGLQMRTAQDKVADAITLFCGDMKFVYVHAILFLVWIMANTGRISGIKAFDPFPFNLLTMVVSLEAIFLSTFVLVSQNRTAAAADARADLDLQINLLAEYEITRTLRLVDRIAEKMGIEEAEDSELDELAKPTSAGEVLSEIQRRNKQRPSGNNK